LHQTSKFWSKYPYGGGPCWSCSKACGLSRLDPVEMQRVHGCLMIDLSRITRTHGPSAFPRQHEPSALLAASPGVPPLGRDSKYDASREVMTLMRRCRTSIEGRGLHPESPMR
jgi:hypothetical protein